MKTRAGGLIAAVLIAVAGVLSCRKRQEALCRWPMIIYKARESLRLIISKLRIMQKAG
ncbi:hypothetical protein PO124_02390 [Bacillus licheniformis]|nr:hypothetical protein [Bacillus licheniformis]